MALRLGAALEDGDIGEARADHREGEQEDRAGHQQASAADLERLLGGALKLLRRVVAHHAHRGTLTGSMLPPEIAGGLGIAFGAIGAAAAE